MPIRSLILAGCALVAPLAAAAPARAAPTTEATAEQPDLEASRAAVGEVDADRLMTDRDYAAGILGHLDRLEPSAAGDPRLRAALDSLRLIALVTVERRDEARALAERVLARRPREADAYSGPIYAALVGEDVALLVTAIETASRNVPGIGWPELRSLLDRDFILPLFGELRTTDQPALRLRLAEALFRIGWPGDGHGGTADYLRSQLIEGRLERGDVQAAADLAAGINAVDQIVPMIVQPRYDPVLGPGRDRLEILREALAEEDRATAEALAAAPEDRRRMLDRVHLLRSAGRNAEALALVEPLIRDVRAAATENEEGMWLINDAAFALIALDRAPEAVALMSQLAALPLEQYPYAISASINYAEILVETGRDREWLDHALRLQSESGDFASDYGDMWIASAIVCALAGLDRAAEAAPQLERMRPLTDVNPAALTQALLCLGDSDAAAALMVRRLEGRDPDSAILALQDYTLSRGVAQAGERYDRLTALRERPDVRAALARVGRILTLPLARTYWGTF